MEEASVSRVHHPWYRVILAPIYLVILLPGLAACMMIPSADTANSTYDELYYSKRLQFSKLTYLIFALASGFAYVQFVTLRCKRSWTLMSSTTYDLGMCLGFGCLLHFLGPNATLLGLNDTSDWGEILMYDFLAWSVAFWLGIHWTHLDSGELKKLVLSWEYMQNWSVKLWAIFSASLLAGFGLAVYNLYLLQDRGLLVYVAVGYSSMFLTMMILAYYFKDTHEFHLHHYQLFAMLIPLTMSQGLVCAACQGYCLGVYCEGIARWGAANCYERRA